MVILGLYMEFLSYGQHLKFRRSTKKSYTVDIFLRKLIMSPKASTIKIYQSCYITVLKLTL